MDKRQEEFLVRLREMFRTEAAEHLAAAAASVAALKQAGPGERAALLEQAFREAHTLKGAARSASLPEVEAVCQALESLFAGLKRGEVEFSPESGDELQSVLDLLGSWCAAPGAAPTTVERERYRVVLAQLKQAATPRTAPSEPEPVPAIVTPAPAPNRETVRVSAARLSALLARAEELVGAKISATQQAVTLSGICRELGDWSRQRVRPFPGLQPEWLYLEGLQKSLGSLARSLYRESHELATTVDAVHEGLRAALMLPCAYLTAQQPQVVRELARQQGKEVEVVVRGEELEIDRRILDELKDVLLHLLRNCVDHGLESPVVRRQRGKPARGTITLCVTPLPGNRVELTVADDGPGIDTPRVREVATRLGLLPPQGAGEPALVDCIFMSGLSTSPVVTELSGRGLGLAIVREKVERLGGTVGVTTVPGSGVCVRLVLPLTLTAFRGVVVETAGQLFVVPSAQVERALRLAPQDLKSVENRPTVLVQDRPVGLARLRDVLGLTGREPDLESRGAAAILVRSGEREVAFWVDRLVGEQEVRVQGLGSRLGGVRNLQAATVSESGAVILILDPHDLVESASSAPGPGVSQPTPAAAPARILVVEDSITARTLLRGILETAGFEVATAVDGLDGLTMLKSGEFDAVVSDIDMPRMNGFELTAKIRADAQLTGLPVILVTALASPRDREYGLAVGANAYIIKSSFDQGDLLNILRRWV